MATSIDSATTTDAPKPRKPQMFDYSRPEGFGTGKAVVNLGSSGLLKGAVHVVKNGAGDNNLHIHTGMDGFYMVLKGECTFYGPEDEVLGVFGINQGITMPHGNAYWFSSTGADELELLQVVGWDGQIEDKRVDLNPPKGDVAPEKSDKFDARVR
jgi:mannose-6-phosphate isomerase-like protein (cupin superfamily)